MNQLILLLLFTVFLMHLVAFAMLWVRRREGYYVALVVTFTLLSTAVGLRLFAPDLQGGNGVRLHELLRYAAWGAAAVSVSWTLTRVARRVRQRGRQNWS